VQLSNKHFKLILTEGKLELPNLVNDNTTTTKLDTKYPKDNNQTGRGFIGIASRPYSKTCEALESPDKF